MAITVITATTARKITWPPPDFSGVFLVDTSGPWHRQCFKAKAELHGYPMFLIYIYMGIYNGLYSYLYIYIW